MKILALADLHFDTRLKDNTRWKKGALEKILRAVSPDVVVIAGDVFESNDTCNPYSELSKIFSGIKTICVLGNHEFVARSVRKTVERYRHLYKPEMWDVHYLDITGHIDVGNVRFVGNFLGYDGSTKDIENQNMNTFANGRWLDVEIKDYDYLKVCEDCKKQILTNLSKDFLRPNLLLTHTVPHINLNMYRSKKSEFNAFSGIKNFLAELDNTSWAICGHTHWRSAGEIINGINCVNIGSDYDNIEYFSFEI